jgi:hypothetical protein
MEARQLDLPAQPFQLSLRVRHPSIDPREISRELCIEAEYSFRAGEARNSRGRTSHVSSHAESYWFAPLGPVLWAADSEPALQSFAASNPTIELALLRCTYLLRRHAGFVRELQASGGEVSLLVEVASDAISGFSLTPMCAGSLHELGVGVDFELTR